MDKKTHLLNKAEEYLKAAGLGVAHKYCAASVHASYYCLILLTLHWAWVDKRQTSRDFMPIGDNFTRFHGQIIAYMATQFKDDIDFQYKVTTTFGDLKGLRVIADYKNETIEFKKAQDAYMKAEYLFGEIIKRLDI